METSKKEVKFYKPDFYLNILKLINEGKNPKKICDDIKIKKQNLNHYISKLKGLKLINKLGYGIWELTEEGKEKLLILQRSKSFSLGTTESKSSINIHALNIQIPILEGLDIKLEGGYDQKFNNWKPIFKRLPTPLGLTLRKTTKNIDIFVWSRNIMDPLEIQPLIMKAVFFTQGYLNSKGIKIDILEARLKTLHLAVQEKFLEKIFNKGFNIEVELDKNITKVFENDEDKKAKVWTDSSPFRGIETNDIEYITKYIQMPITLGKIGNTLNRLSNEAINPLTEQIKLHLQVMQDMRDTLKQIQMALKK